MQRSPELQKRIRLQVMVLIALIIVGAVMGAYLFSSGIIPDQYEMTPGEAVPKIKVPDGFAITVFANELTAPRYMVIHPPGGDLLVSERGAARIVALPDADQDGIFDDRIVVAENLEAPTGLAIDGEWLYVAEDRRVVRIRLDDDYGELERQIIIPNLPSGHNKNEEDSISHALLIHEGELYVSVGASCAACLESDSRRATIMVYNLDGSNERVFAKGLYYVLGMAVNPLTGEVWAANQGRAKFIEDVPETIYSLQLADHAGWPGCHAGSLIDTELGDEDSCENIVQPLLRITPQSNITGIAFYNNPDAPETYQYDLLAVLHGGVTLEEQQVGMAIVRFDIDPTSGELVSKEADLFAGGWWFSTTPGDYLGRPSGILMAPDGVLYISDDSLGVIYSVHFTG